MTDHRVDCCIPYLQPALVESNGRKVEDSGEDRLHDGDDEASMDDELGELGRSFVGVST
jgi:hypothetical protein